MKLQEFVELQFRAVKQLGDTSKGHIKFDVMIDDQFNVGAGANRVKFDVTITPNGIVVRRWQLVLLLTCLTGTTALLLQVVYL